MISLNPGPKSNRNRSDVTVSTFVIVTQFFL
jgi:hypothetical protein